MRLSQQLLSERWAPWVAASIGILVLLVAMGISRTDPAKVMELRLLDERYMWRGEQEADPRIVVLGIDEQSIDYFSERGMKWPWPNRIYGEAVDILAELGAEVITFDKLFKDPTSPDNREDEKMLAAAALKHGKVAFSANMQAEFVGNSIGITYEEPMPVIANAGKVGFVDMPMDKDHAVRRATFLARHQDKMRMSLDLHTYLLFRGLTFEDVSYVPGKRLRVGDLDVPTDSLNSAYVNFPGRDAFAEQHFFSLFEPEMRKELETSDFFKGKIVYIGATSDVFHDDYPTPYSRAASGSRRKGTSREYGVHIHCAILNTLLTGRTIRPIPLRTTAWISLLMGIAVVLVLSRAGFKLSLLLSVGLAAAYLYFGFALFSRWRIYVDIVTPLSAVIPPSIAMLYYKFLYEQTQKRQIRTYWSRYVSGDIVDLMVDGKLSVELGGQRKEVTVMMLDIRDFTPLCEQLPPNELLTQLNEFFTEMAKAIFEHKGTIDKFTGDGIMAYWGFPHAKEDHRERSLLASADMVSRLRKLQETWEVEKKPVMKIGIGLNTGEVTVGNVGAEVGADTIQNFTLLGDAVNLAARLESENKKHGSTIIASESTWEPVKGVSGLRAECLGEIFVKGKTESTKSYRIDLDE